MAELRALSAETDPEILETGLLEFARRLTAQDREDVAAKIYSALGREPDANENLVQHFAGGATDYRTMLPMFAASIVGPWARVASPARFSGLAAFAAEVPTFAASSYLLSNRVAPFSQHLLVSALSLGSLQFAGYGAARAEAAIGAKLGRSASFLHAGSLVLGLAAAQSLEAEFGIGQGPNAIGLLAQLVNLQVGRHLGHAFFRPRFQAADREARPSGLSWFPEFLAESRAHAFASGARPPSEPLPIKMTRPMQMSELRDNARVSDKLNILTPGQLRVPPPSEQARLREKYLRLFPGVDRHTYSEEIILHLLNTPSSLPGFHDKMLTALARSPIAGSKAQYALAMNLELLFSADPLRLPTGGFQWALWQWFIERALGDSDQARSQAALLSFLDLMEIGPDREGLARLQRTYGYGGELSLERETPYSLAFWNRHFSFTQVLLRGYRLEDRGLLLNAVHRIAGGDVDSDRRLLAALAAAKYSGTYDPDLIDAVLDHARVSPWGTLVVNRLLQVLMVEDVPAKLKEILPEGIAESTHLAIERMHRSGAQPEAIAASINGGVHTGYLEDPKLARHAVDVMLASAAFMRDPRQRESGFEALEKAFYAFVASGERLSPKRLMEMFGTNPHPLAGRLQAAVAAGKVLLEIKSDAEFRQIVETWGQAPETEVSLLLKEMRPGAPFRILIRDLPPIELATTGGEWRAFSEVMHRLKALAHEAGHFEDFAGGSAFRPEMTRNERHASEAMALFSEFGFRIRNIDQWFLDQSRRLGDSLGLYFRNLSDQSYYAHRNAQLLKGIRFFVNDGE